jgi:predicted DsbA family dithiol-disulfide isomerase
MQKHDTIQIVVWSDYVCPFCYLERPVLDQVKEEFGEQVQIDWRAFELRPEPTPTLDPSAEQRGVILRLPPVQPYSRKAHEAAEFAREQGLLDEMNRALFKAFFEDGRDLANPDVLIDIGLSAGLDAVALRDGLDSGRYTQAVVEDERVAREVGISGVPALIVSAGGQAYLLSGAQPIETVREVIARARTEVRGIA